MQVHKAMTALPLTAEPDTTLDAALEIMEIWALRHLPIVETEPGGGKKLVGVVSERDLLSVTGWLPESMRVMRRPLEADSVRVMADLMHTDLVTAGPAEQVAEVARRVVDHHIGCVPVVEEGALVGILTVTDILRTFATLCEGRGLCAEVDPPVSALMSPSPVAIDSTATLGQAREAMARADARHLPVRSAQATRGEPELIGIVSDSDIRRALGCGRKDDHPVVEFLTGHPRAGKADMRASAAAALLSRGRFGSLPIVQDPSTDRTLIGIVTTVDLLRHCSVVLDSTDHWQPHS